MRRHTTIAAGLALALGVAGCDDFLTGPGLTENPNAPLTPTSRQLLAASQAAHFNLQEGQLARLSSIYMQHVTGTNNQQLNWGTQYAVTEQDITARFNQFYNGGGLVDHRKVQELARQEGDAKLEGVARIMEALLMGTATSIWGDIPYREAATGIATPKLDPQEQVYQDLQKALDDGIALLGGAGVGPTTFDHVYGGNVERWRRAAYTLKARYHLHTAERLGTPAYQAALAAAGQGINEAPTSVAQATHGQAPGDFRALHGGTVTDGNLWAQFLNSRQDIVAGGAMVQLLSSRSGDPRLAGYFDPAPAVAASANCAGYAEGYRGADHFGRFVPAPCAGASPVDAETRRAYPFRQPIVTWAENQLIMAEALVALNRAGDATPHVNNVRRAVGMGDLPSPVTLEQVMQEKYIVMFQNIESWSDYRRTCFPRLTPGGTVASPARAIPGRLPYGSAERLNNPDNIKPPSEYGERNWNDPNPCTT